MWPAGRGLDTPAKSVLMTNTWFCNSVCTGGRGGGAVQPVLPLDLRAPSSLFPQESKAAKWSLSFQTLTLANCDYDAFAGVKTALTVFPKVRVHTGTHSLKLHRGCNFTWPSHYLLSC